MKASMWIKPFLFTLLVLIAPIATYYVYYVESRETLLLDRFHAHLANAGAQTEARLESEFSILGHNAKDRTQREVCGAARNGRRSLIDLGAGKLSFHLGKSCSDTADAGELVGTLDPERRFYDIAILSDKGVVYQRDLQNGRIDSTQLAPADEASDDSEARVTDPLRNMRISYQGRAFLVFSQPLFVAGAGVAPDAAADSGTGTDAGDGGSNIGTATAEWRIVGLLEEEAFNGLKWSASSANVAIVALVLLGVLLGSPFLKLWYLGRFEPLSRFDVLLLIGAGFGLVAMLTVTLLAWDTEMRLTDYSDRRLAAIAHELGKRTRTEIEGAVDALHRLEPRLLEKYALRVGNALERTSCPYLAQYPPTVGGNLYKTWPEEAANYRSISMTYLMDANGCQLVKWSSAEQWTEPGQFADRDYFRRALPDPRTALDLFEVGDSPGRAYFQGVITSRTTGERELVFSKPVEATTCDPQTANDGPSVPCVSVVTGKLRALEYVLPSGYGAMLVDRDAGIAWAGGDEGASSELNLAKELDAPERLRAMVTLAVAGHDTSGAPFDGDYRGSPHRFLVLPAGVGELALVVFYDRDIVLTTVLESVGVAVVAWSIWMFVFGLLVLAFWFADDMTERAVRREPALLAIALLVLGAIASFALAVTPWLILGALGIPLLLLLSLARMDRLPKNARGRRSLLMLATWLAVLTTAALPMVLFYDDASERALSALERSSAFESAGVAQRRIDARNAWMYRVGKPEWTAFLQGDRAYPFLEPVMDEPQITASGACTGLSLVCEILYYLPDYSSSVAGRHAIYRTPAVAVNEREDVQTRLLAQAPPGGFALLIAATCLFAALLAVGIRYLMVRLFGLHAENVVEARSFVLPKENEQAHWLVYGAARADREKRYFKPLKAKAKRWIDLRDESGDSEEAKDPAVEAIAFDEFDAGLNSIETLRRRVELLERVLHEKRRVILLFVVTDPLNFASATYHSADDAVLLSRFAAALARFKFVYADVVKAEEKPRSRRRGLAARVLDIVRLQDHPSSRLAVVAAECRHPDLWQIRDELLNQPGVQDWTEAQIVQQVQTRANAIYQRMWSQCTRAEKFTLIELARGNPINPNNWDAARRLRVRGYVRVDPFYRIGSESLRQFVLRMAQVEDVRSWNDASPGAWTQIKVPLLVLFIGTLVFLGVTQPNMFNSVLAFLVAGAAGAPFLFNALNARLQRAVEGRSS